MKLITETVFNSFLPNLQLEAKGEKTMFEKCKSALSSREMWLHTELLGTGVYNYLKQVLDENDPIMADEDRALIDFSRSVIFNAAMYEMLPVLNVVLTPNGLGIVSTSTIAPASSERVQELRNQYRRTYNNAFVALFRSLCEFPGWSASQPCARFEKLLLTPVDIWLNDFLLPDQEKPYDIWELYSRYAPKVRQLEEALTETLVGSRSIYDALRTYQINLANREETYETTQVAIELAQLEMAILKQTPRARWNENAVQKALYNSTFKEAWLETSAGKAYHFEKYANELNKSGYIW